MMSHSTGSDSMNFVRRELKSETSRLRSTCFIKWPPILLTDFELPVDPLAGPVLLEGEPVLFCAITSLNYLRSLNLILQ